MKDQAKSKDELIEELNELRRKNAELEAFHSKSQYNPDYSGTETILVVDDNDQLRTTIVLILEDFGYTVIEAASSKEALHIFETNNENIDLVLVDIVLPDLPGPDLVEQILVIDPDIKVVFMSGYAEDIIVHEKVFSILDSGTTFIKKPFTINEIGSIVRQRLDNLMYL